MFRFTIRDVLWLMVVVSILALWAMERRWMSHDWASIHRNNGRILEQIKKQAEANKLHADRLREWERKLNEMETARQHTLVEAEPNP